MEAIATVREAIAFAVFKKVPLCVLSLDFKNALDRISHKYLYSTLRCYGISDLFIDRLKKMYDGATSSMQLNGHTYGPIPIRCAIWQGRPLSIVLYVLRLHPLLRMLEQRLPGIKIGRRARPTSIVAYADDITIFVTSTDDFPS
jgi:hypothetical protein